MTWSWSKSGTDLQVDTHKYQFIGCVWCKMLLKQNLCFLKDISPPSIFHIPADHEPDKQLTDWLKEQGADADTIDKVEYLFSSERPSVSNISS